MNTAERKTYLISEAKYYGDFNLIGAHIVKAKKTKPENKTIGEMYKCWQSVGFYVHGLITKAEHIEQIISEYREDKLRAVLRARKADEKVLKLEKIKKKLKVQINVGL